MLVGLCRWIHPASGHRCILSLVEFQTLCNDKIHFYTTKSKSYLFLLMCKLQKMICQKYWTVQRNVTIQNVLYCYCIPSNVIEPHTCRLTKRQTFVLQITSSKTVRFRYDSVIQWWFTSHVFFMIARANRQPVSAWDWCSDSQVFL